MSNDSNSPKDNRRAKWRLRAASVSVLILGGALLVYGIVLALSAVAAAFALIAMGVIILAIAFAVEVAARKLQDDGRKDHNY